MIPRGNQQNATPNGIALHWAQQSFQNWQVVLVGEEGDTLQILASDQADAPAVAFAVAWQSKAAPASGVVVVIPVLED